MPTPQQGERDEQGIAGAAGSRTAGGAGGEPAVESAGVYQHSGEPVADSPERQFSQEDQCAAQCRAGDERELSSPASGPWRRTAHRVGSTGAEGAKQGRRGHGGQPL
ncbi:hypothetical protein AERO8C_30229 [Aeromonas veronii]|uniref:Uncharacterized protein n=1 Tax=Aeromonas veronii TaxID=654 RepID=A0A653L718_AERVE|nr:hypothetical protein AERO8C_30229 [Aeromonas veronii]